MRSALMVLAVLAGMAAESAATEEAGKKRSAKQKGSPTQALPEVDDEVLVSARKQKAKSKKEVKWEGPDYDSTRRAGKKKGKK